MSGFRYFCQRGSNTDNIFKLIRGERNQIPPQIPLKAIEMAFHWHADDGPTLNAGLVALWFFRGSGPVLLRSPIVYDFSGRGGPEPLLPLLDTRRSYLFTKSFTIP